MTITRAPRFRSLSPILRCPDRRCARAVYINPESITSALPCDRCKGHFWVTRLDAGCVRQQLVQHFYGEEAIVDRMMLMFDLPLVLDQPMYWHIWLSGAEFHEYNRDVATGIWARSKGMFRRLLVGKRRASSILV